MSALLVAGWIVAFVWQWQLPVEAVASQHVQFGVRLAEVRALLDGVLVDGRRIEVVQSAITHGAFHVGAIGLLANSFFLLAYGSRLEARAGIVRFGLLLLICQVGGTVVASLLFDGANEAMGRTLVGGAAVTAGVVGAHFVWFPRASILVCIPPMTARIPTLLAIAAWAVAQWHPLQCLLRIGDAEPVPPSAIAIAAAFGVCASWVVWPSRKRPPRRG